MSVKIDLDAARALLRLEAHSLEPVPVEWVDIVARLTAACKHAPKTHIAMLGTALLAKAVDARVDVFALKVAAGTEGAYTARRLAKDVLAALAPSLGIDLGVTGREPLNNQPYFREPRITREMEKIIRADGLPPFRIVYAALERLQSATQEEACSALRAFLRGRQRKAPVPLDPDVRISASPSLLASRIRDFVEEDSEGGRSAQGIAAALLDVVFGPEWVEVDRISDPDRHFPGDVGVNDREAPHSLVRAYEVRDKPVEEHDLHHFIEKAHTHKARRAGVICASRNQPRFDLTMTTDSAFERGIALRVYFGWTDLITDVLFQGGGPPHKLVERLGLAVYERLMELEVSPEGLARWRRLVKELLAS
ncbi:MAG: restriction endonuclease, SacI family [Gemmatimonadales bacterium]|jgi:hypothetical protein|nr:restriction endonuclease, SacI family [Gemmatimonadales bacterium]